MFDRGLSKLPKSTVHLNEERVVFDHNLHQIGKNTRKYLFEDFFALLH